MYSIGQTYKFEIIGKIYYTGKILEENHVTIRIKTIRDEDLILNKQQIKQARLEKPELKDG